MRFGWRAGAAEHLQQRADLGVVCGDILRGGSRLSRRRAQANDSGQHCGEPIRANPAEDHPPSLACRDEDPCLKICIQPRVRIQRWIITLCLGSVAALVAAQPQIDSDHDSDHDGLSDAVEQALLVQFEPAYRIAPHDCSGLPAAFWPNSVTPRVKAEDATIYGQVFPAKDSTAEHPVVEIHYYDLWQRDCGPHGHLFDTEHVSVLVRASDSHLATARWTALYWYAAAHENTVCDVSQIARASTLQAQNGGATIWVSPGKHASYLDSALCRAGCGADHCEQLVPLHVRAVVNLGEPGHPMSGAIFNSSGEWPLAEKMAVSNFPASAIARLDQLPSTDIAWFVPGRHPVQGVIAVSGTTGASIAEGGRDTSEAISTANDSTNAALSTAEDSTGNALTKSYRKTIHALGSTVKHVDKALSPGKEPGSANGNGKEFTHQ